MTLIAKAKTTMLVLGAALVLQAMPLQAQTCAAPATLDDLLFEQGKYFGFIGFVGAAPNLRSVLFYINQETRTWSIVEMDAPRNPSTEACIVVEGFGLQYANELESAGGAQ